MAYLPKSKYSVKSTPGDEFVYKDDKKQIYIGDYMLTSNGKYYAGVSNTRLGPELIPIPKRSMGDRWKVFGSSKDVKKHIIFKKDIKEFFEKVEPIPEEKPFPTDKEYEIGYFKRYFAKRINGEIFIEINSETYNDILKKKPKYDHYLYEIGSLTWHLKGNVFLKNSVSIKKTQKLFKAINFHFPILDEYKLEENLLQTHLYTEGGELYLANGKDYIGEYHIHESGPMVGPIHTDTPHERLYYVSKLPAPPDTTYQDFLNSLPPTPKKPKPKAPPKIKALKPSLSKPIKREKIKKPKYSKSIKTNKPVKRKKIALATKEVMKTPSRISSRTPSRSSGGRMSSGGGRGGY